MKEALLIVPPLIGYASGPLAGPAHLVGAGRAAGVDVRVLDLNAAWMNTRVKPVDLTPGVSGDHARVRGLREAKREWAELMVDLLGACPPAPGVHTNPALTLCAGHREVHRAARRLAASPLGRSWRDALPDFRPGLVGISVMWSGQVIAALALSRIAKRCWPGTPIVWGGAHVAALARYIATDAGYGRWIDGFVAGYAEATFQRMLTCDPLAAPGVFRAGSGQVVRAEGAVVVPAFPDWSSSLTSRLVLPAQTSRGCGYGRCAFCTYPAREGIYRPLPVAATVTPVLDAAICRSAEISFKDAFLSPARLDEVARVIRGRTTWSCSIRLVPTPTRQRLHDLAIAGLRTVEVGIESTNDDTLRRLGKKQSRDDLFRLMDAAANTGIHVVLNVMAGFPWEREQNARDLLRLVDDELPARFPETLFSTERNLLQVERGSPMGEQPARWAVDVVASWPWASVLGWRAPAWCAQMHAEFSGFHAGSRPAREAA